MKTQWQPVIKPTLLIDIYRLPAKEAQQIFAKIGTLLQDPLPDGHMKKRLKYLNREVYRLRSGRYRLFYTLNDHTINILTLRLRDDDTYRDDIDLTNDLADEELDDLADLALVGNTPTTVDWERFVSPRQPASTPLPEPMNSKLLTTLHVPAVYHPALLRVSDRDALYACEQSGVPADLILRLDEYFFARPLGQVLQQPDLVLNDVDDLLRYREGELLAFLLKLSPEQEKYTRWSLKASGPALVKGGPGTGKSTVALYRIRSLLAQLLTSEQHTPRILFTTYTNALVKASEQQLNQLLGANAPCVQVETADKLVYGILQELNATREIVNDSELRKITNQAVQQTTLPGNPLQQAAQQQTLRRMGLDYLLQELNGVIVARQLTSLTEYQQTPRTGRKLRLNATQRQGVWLVYEHWCSLLLASGQETWQQRRARAATFVAQSSFAHAYDAVVIDEAQDLDPTVLRLLIQVCRASDRMFITADANQSIYGSGFTWQDIHADLKFQGRTSILRANYRSTSEIGEAAFSFLASGILESEVVERQYVNSGPLPDVRSVENHQYEIQLLVSFFKQASRDLRLTLGSCAVLCPNKGVGQSIALDLTQAGLEANYMEGRELNLTHSGIKVLTLSSAKGLEFPIVALAGLLSANYPFIPRTASEDERAEILARERRTLYVGMTRAMRGLLVVVPTDPSTPLFTGFDASYWNVKGGL